MFQAADVLWIAMLAFTVWSAQREIALVRL